MEYLNYYRLNMGKRLLASTEMTVTEIAHETGFYDSAHFSNLYRKYFGSSPLKARKVAAP